MHFKVILGECTLPKINVEGKHENGNNNTSKSIPHRSQTLTLDIQQFSLQTSRQSHKRTQNISGLNELHISPHAHCCTKCVF